MSSAQPQDVGAIVSANLRRLRTQADLSLGELARRSGLSKSTVSALESGGANPNIETLWAIAVALGVPFGQLVAEPTGGIRTVRAGEGARVGSRRDTGYAVRLLSSTPQRAARDLYVLEAEPGRARTADAHIAGTIEHAVCARGAIRLGPVGHEVQLGEGDYAVFGADVPHTYEALAPETRVVLVMEYP